MILSYYHFLSEKKSSCYNIHDTKRKNSGIDNKPETNPFYPMAEGGIHLRLLVVEDEKDMNRLIVKTLQQEGYTVDSCYDGREALEYLDCADYDGAILDVMLPGLSGHEVITSVRNQKNPVPVLFLSARDSVADRITGLDLGADDYLIKPFDFDELLARIRAMTRKYAQDKNTSLSLGDLTLDTKTHSVTRAGKEISLSAKEYSILEYMLRNQGIVLSRERLENSMWNFDYSGGSNVVDVYISYLRKKIDDGFSKKLIHTVRGAGWVLKEESV